MANTKKSNTSKTKSTKKEVEKKSTKSAKTVEKKNTSKTKAKVNSKTKNTKAKKVDSKNKDIKLKAKTKTKSKSTKKKTALWLVLGCLAIAIVFGVAFLGDYTRETPLGTLFATEMSERDKAIEVAMKKLEALNDNTSRNELKTTKKKYKNDYFYIIESKNGNVIEVRIGDYKITSVNGEK